MLTEKDIVKLDFVYNLIEEMERNVVSAYEVLSNAKYEGDIQYQLSLSLLNVAETNYVPYSYVIREIGAERSETYEFEKGYEEFKDELHSYVLEKDTNPGWLGTRKDQFKKKCNVLKDFIREVNRNYRDRKHP